MTNKEKLALGMRIYDTCDPVLSINAISKMVHIDRGALARALRLRYARHPYRCKHCGLAPGERTTLKQFLARRKEKS